MKFRHQSLAPLARESDVLSSILGAKLAILQGASIGINTASSSTFLSNPLT